MSDVPITATQVLKAERHTRLEATMHRLLHRLEGFARVYPMFEADVMPEHDIKFVTGPNDGPDKAVLDAIKSNPNLWAPALPPQVCIVPREQLRMLGLTDSAIEFLEGAGANMVANQAARYEHELESRDRY